MSNFVFPIDISKSELADHIRDMTSENFARFLYCQHMSATFMAVHQLEHTLASAMLMCDRIKVGKILQDDIAAWERLLRKQSDLQNSTLGSLISIFSRHSAIESDIAYLRWIKEKRDYFVHRLFHDGAWPGDLNVDDCRYMTRRLMAIQFWLSRADRNIWYIFQRAGFLQVKDLKEDGLFIANSNLFNKLTEP